VGAHEKKMAWTYMPILLEKIRFNLFQDLCLKSFCSITEKKLTYKQKKEKMRERERPPVIDSGFNES
jgi:hypothetical protein